MCFPGQCLALFGILHYAVTSPLLRIATGHRVVTLLHNPAFGEPFVIKLLGACGIQALSRNMLEEGVLVISC